jgi:hypothetical protein
MNRTTEVELDSVIDRLLEGLSVHQFVLPAMGVDSHMTSGGVRYD